ncbi:putative tail fiber protein [Salmonella phage 41]|nr:putative tail fiber protein [Salmonella phage 41]
MLGVFSHNALSDAVVILDKPDGISDTVKRLSGKYFRRALASSGTDAACQGTQSCQLD